jgi:biopolymer transport protein ExbD
MRRKLVVTSSHMAILDVILILFAFFLSVSQIRKSTVKVDLPEVSDAVATGEREDPSKPVRMVIHLGSDGVLGFERETFHTREVFFERFREAASRERAAGRPVVAEIITDRTAESGTVVDLINFLTKEGVKRLEFLAVEKGK